VRILIILKNRLDEETVRNTLAHLAEQDSLYFCYSYHEAENFITNNIIANQLPLDLIICENRIRGLSAVEFYRRITANREATFSNGHFYFHTIPVVLIAAPGENANAFGNDGFAALLDSSALDNLQYYTDDLVSAVKQWRRNFLGDLSNMGIYHNGHQLLYQYSKSERRRAGIYTSTITDDYKREPEPLTYDWITTGGRSIEIGIDKLQKEVKRAARLNTHEERRIAQLLHRYQFLAKRDNFSDFWQETRLPRDGSKSYRLDVTLKPNFNQVTDLTIIELKLPNEKFIRGNQFHPTLRQNVVRHISQVNDYKEWFENSSHPDISGAIGFVPEKIQYNVLMGRMEDKQHHLQTLNKRLNEFNAGHINLMTYDEFIDLQIQYHKRHQLLNIL